MPDLPTGTITFLFTDIEGSTRLWEQHPEPMRQTLARHDALLKEAIENHNGTVFKTVGDAFCAAFATAPDALFAALAAQQALHTESWPAETPIRVRMALHTGAAEQREGDYFGPPLNRVARLLSIGYGGQVLVSEAAANLVRDGLPEGIGLQDAGEHRLRDLTRPEHVYQLLHPALPAQFPPLRSLNNPSLPNNLPVQVTSFVGREKETEEIKSLLARTRLLTLTGIGGCGKTRLAQQVAADLLEQYLDGVWLVELAPLSDPDLVAQAVATVLQVREEPGQPLLQTLAAALKPRQFLLVLDNCEHLLAACAQLADTLLHTCPHIQILASSREGLNIAGELTYRVPSLSLPERSQAISKETLSQYEAVRLFIERAVFQQPAFTLTPQNAPALAAICQRLDGIPLAIELAAARVRSLTVEQIASRLDDRFRLLTGGSRTALPRQQTLRALIDWSYSLLTEPERKLLCRLSVFAGGWTLEAAVAVCSADGYEVLDLLTSLVDKSLVGYEEQEGQGRYRLLETMRQYGREKLLESGESEMLHARHQDWFLQLAEQAEPLLLGPEQAHWLDCLEREHDNLRAALEWIRTARDGAQTGLRLAGALAYFWHVRGYRNEAREWFLSLLSLEGAQQPTAARAKALIFAGLLANIQGDHTTARPIVEEGLSMSRQLGGRQGVAWALYSLGELGMHNDPVSARPFFEESLTLYRELADTFGIGVALSQLAEIAKFEGDYAAARSFYEQSLEVRRQAGDRIGQAWSLTGLGSLAYIQGDYASARTFLEEALTISRSVGDKHNLHMVLNALGNLAMAEGELASARTSYEESLALRRELDLQSAIAGSLNNLANVVLAEGDTMQAQSLYAASLEIYEALEDRGGVAMVTGNMGGVAVRRQDYVRARGLYRDSLAQSQALGMKRMIAECLEGLAAVLTRSHPAAKPEESLWKAARLWGAAEHIRQATGQPMPLPDRMEQELHITAAREALGEEPFEQAWADGHAMTLEQAVAYALQEA